MRAAAFQAQQQQKTQGGTTSFIMPIYTLGIVAFFVFTIVKIVMKKVNKEKPTTLESDPIFVEKVFKQVKEDPKKKLGEFILHLAIFKFAVKILFFQRKTKICSQDGKITTQVRVGFTNISFHALPID